MANKSTIVKTVDKTQVVNNERFVYTYDIGFSGINDEGTSSFKLKDFFPTKIKYQLPKVEDIPNLKGITETKVTGGTEVVFDFGEINTGVSSKFQISATFGPGRVQNDQFKNIADLVIAKDGQEETVSAEAPIVNLTLEGRLSLSKSMKPDIVKPGEEVTIILNLTNTAPGLEWTDIKLEDILPKGLIADETQPIVGDYSKYAIDDADPITTSGWSNNTMTFTIDKFLGSSYKVTFKAKAEDDVVPGSIIKNTGTAYVKDEKNTEAFADISVYEDKPINPRLQASKSGPKYAKIGDEIYYSIAFRCLEGDLTDVVITDEIPEEFTLTSLRMSNPQVPYTISIATSDNPTNFKQVSDGDISGEKVIDLTDKIPSGSRVVEVKVDIPNITINRSATLYLYGLVNDKAVLGSSFVNNAKYTANSIKGTVGSEYNHTIEISDKVVLGIEKKLLSPVQTIYYALDVLKFSLKYLAGKNPPLSNPVIIDVLSEGLEYQQGSAKFYLKDRYSNKEYISGEPDFPLQIPEIEIIPDFPTQGEKTIRWNFDGQTIPYGYDLTVEFNAVIGIDDVQKFMNRAYLGNKGKDAEIDSKSNNYIDVFDLDNDGITDETIAWAKTQVTGNILQNSTFRINKEVKGDNDSEFSMDGTTVSGGNGEFILALANGESNALKDIEIVDILPHIGDTSVITSEKRKSQYPVYPTKEINAEVINVITGEVKPNTDIIIEYSSSYDPVRFGINAGEIIGTVDDWSTTVPTNIADIKSIKLKTKPGFLLEPYEQIRITIDVTTPVGVMINAKANNSFAARASKDNGDILASTESPKVTLKIVGEQKSTIGDFVWIDDGNGIKKPDDVGINGIKVELYGEDGITKIAETITADNFTGDPGYYMFGNLEPGKYTVKFISIEGYNLTKQQVIDPNGSTPNAETGFTDVFELGINEDKKDIDAGVVVDCPGEVVINAKKQCIHIGDTFDPLANVTATDCDGSNIPLTSANVIKNTVDTSKEGIYEVEYTVTSPKNGSTVTKTIQVKVCARSAREQSIADLIESVALEQTALSHILNAEGEKIQAAKRINATTDELLDINKSVDSMLATVTKLETVLASKLALFSKCKGSSCCDEFLNED